MEKVIPPGINYADIKPEAIENQIKILRFTPARTGLYQGNDIIRFNIQGNGFFDPYSAYLKFTINLNRTTFPDPALNAATTDGLFLDRSGHSIINRLVLRSQGQELERIEEYDVLAAMINDILYSQEQKQLHHFEGFGVSVPLPCGNGGTLAETGVAFHHLTNTMIKRQQMGCIDRFLGVSSNQNMLSQEGGVVNGGTVAQYVRRTAGGQIQYINAGGLALGNGDFPKQMQICIPIYSGIIGVLMPDKKLLPLSLIPLELELTVNQHAMYSMFLADAAANGQKNRDFYLSNVELYAHVLFFEQELHRSLEAVVAEHGIFIHYNSFRQAPITANTGAAGSSILSYAQINSHAKSINSVHWVFVYDRYLTVPYIKKLQFQTHNVTKIQIRNGTELWPSEPIEGNFSTDLGREMSYTQFMVEMYKAWGKMHDPTTDSGLNSINYTLETFQEIDSGGNVIADPAAMNDRDQRVRYVVGRALTPSCQYGVSFEGEQLGTEKTTITGKRGLIPFDINITGTKSLGATSYMFIFVRADYILYVRPDLVVTKLGD